MNEPLVVTSQVDITKKYPDEAYFQRANLYDTRT